MEHEGDINEAREKEMAEVCMKGDTASVGRLFSTDVDFRTPLEWTDSDGKTLTSPPMFIAIDYDHIEMVRAFLDAGAPIELKDENDYTVLQWASWTGHMEIVRMLIDAGAKVDEEALDLAKEYGHKEVAALLFETVDLYSSLDDTDEIMDKACRRGDTDKVKSLLDDGYDYKKWKDEEGNYHKYSPMFMAFKFGHLDIVQAFTEAGSTINDDDYDQEPSSLQDPPEQEPSAPEQDLPETEQEQSAE